MAFSPAHRSFALALLSLLPSLFPAASGATLAEWRSRAIYQVVTDRFAPTNTSESLDCDVEAGLYCGGTWQGLKAKLDYIQGMNFDAIWISPVVAQLPQRTGDGEAYAGYWQQDLYALNPHFGTAADLRDLVAAMHERGMYLMLDIVVNHMGYAGVGWAVDPAVFNPFDDAAYFHDFCVITEPYDANNTEVCWLGDPIVSLADLRTEDPDVRAMFGQWIAGMVANYSVDGLRIDSSLNVEPSFFTGFVNTAGVFATGEVFMDDEAVACDWAETIGSILNYPIYFPLVDAFGSTTGSIEGLVQKIDSVKATCHDPTAFGSFSENQDVPRFASYTDDLSLAKNVITYTIMADGIPIIYQGQEQHMTGVASPDLNRAPLWDAGYLASAPLYGHIATLNHFRQHVLGTSPNYTEYMNTVIFNNVDTLAMRKGFDGSQVITVLNNNGAAAPDYTLGIPNHGFPAGTALTEILTCTPLAVNATGYIPLPVSAGKPKVLYPTALLAGSALCGAPEQAYAPASSSSSSSTPANAPHAASATATASGAQGYDAERRRGHSALLVAAAIFTSVASSGVLASSGLRDALFA